MQLSDKDLVLSLLPYNPRQERFYEWKDRFARLFGTSPHTAHNIYYERKTLSDMERTLLSLAVSGRISLCTTIKHHQTKLERAYEEIR